MGMCYLKGQIWFASQLVWERIHILLEKPGKGYQVFAKNLTGPSKFSLIFFQISVQLLGHSLNVDFRVLRDTIMGLQCRLLCSCMYKSIFCLICKRVSISAVWFEIRNNYRK